MSRLFRVSGWLEGGSYLLLLLVAMPLKYVWDMPAAVSVVGMAHGVLFLLYCGLALLLVRAHGWSLRKLLYAWIAALLPFGPFVFDARFLHRDF